MLARRALPEVNLSTAVQAAGIACAYFVADAVLNKIALGDGWKIFWPLNGVTIALLISRPRREWFPVLVAVAFGTGVGEYIDDNSLTSTLVQRALSVLEVGLSAALLPPFLDLESWLGTPQLYPRFAAAVLLGPLVSGVLAALYFHFTEATPLLSALSSWALADAMGIAAVMPLALALRPVRLRELLDLKRGLAMAGTLLPAFALMALIFATSRYPLVFMLYPLLMLVDWLLGLLGSSIALCGACVLAVFLTEHGFGPFANASGLGISRDLALQAYLGFHLIGFLPTSILFLRQRCLYRELRHSLAQAARLATLDSLTGVANRRALDSNIEEQWLLATRNQTPLALLMIDADHFKQYNDRLGHQAGDACLRALANALTKRVSRPGDLVARFGGEEFAVLLPDTPLEGARHVGEMIRLAVHNLAIAHPGNPLPASGGLFRGQPRVTVSIGCAALVPTPGTRVQQLIELADQAMYEAKRSGRDRVCVVDPDAHVWSPGAAARKLRARIDAYRHRLGLPRRASSEEAGRACEDLDRTYPGS